MKPQPIPREKDLLTSFQRMRPLVTFTRIDPASSWHMSTPEICKNRDQLAALVDKACWEYLVALHLAQGEAVRTDLLQLRLDMRQLEEESRSLMVDWVEPQKKLRFLSR